MTQLSTGSLLAWRIAARIAIGKKQQNIDNEHLLIGICYLNKLASHESEIRKHNLTSQEQSDFFTEHSMLVSFFEKSNLDPEELRHRLWDRLPEGSHKHEGETLHRSQSCKEAFTQAASLADSQGSRNVSSLHLLASIFCQPGSIISSILNDIGIIPGELSQTALETFLLMASSLVKISGDFDTLSESSQDRGQTVRKGSSGRTKPGDISSQTSSGCLTLQYGRDLTEEASAGKLNRCLGRRKELLKIVQTLARRKRRNILLVGENGVGKTTIVHELAYRIAAKKDGPTLPEKQLIQLDSDLLLRRTASGKKIGQRFSKVIDEIKNHPGWIIFFEDINRVLLAGQSKRVISELPELFRTAIKRGEIHCIGTITSHDYKQHVKPDTSVDRLFEKIFIKEPSNKETLRILQALKPMWEEHHGVHIGTRALETAVTLSAHLDPQHRLPEKAIDLVDKACVHTRMPDLSLFLHEDIETEESENPIPEVTEDNVIRVAAETWGMPYTTVFNKLNRQYQTDKRKMILLKDAVKMFSKISEEIISSRDMFHEYPTLLGCSSKMKKVYQRIQKVASTNEPVLIVGETGTGKELVARAIHHLSQRAGKPLIVLNSAAIPEDLVESELFGHEKGAFTGASAMKKGKFELADSSTLFLDEIGDMSLKTQAKILRIIQEQTLERVGGHKLLKVDVRLLAATHKNLKDLIRKDVFRKDLFYRLNVYPIILPTLRERPEDIPLLATSFILESQNQNSTVSVKLISPEAVALLIHYPWPGNVRQLRNVIRSVVVDLAGENRSTIELADLENALNALEKYYTHKSGEIYAYNTPAVGGHKIVPKEQSPQQSGDSLQIDIESEVNRWLSRFEKGEQLDDHKNIYRSYGHIDGIRIYVRLFEEGKKRYGTLTNFIKHIGLQKQHSSIRNKLFLFRRKLTHQ